MQYTHTNDFEERFNKDMAKNTKSTIEFLIFVRLNIVGRLLYLVCLFFFNVFFFF